MARPRKQIDLEKLCALSLIGASYATMARHLGCSADTLERHYRKEIEESRASGELRILGKIYQSALAGNVRCLELSAINRLGWALKPELVVNVAQNVAPIHTPEAVKKHLLMLQQEIRAAALAQQQQLPQ